MQFKRPLISLILAWLFLSVPFAILLDDNWDWPQIFAAAVGGFTGPLAQLFVAQFYPCRLTICDDFIVSPKFYLGPCFLAIFLLFISGHSKRKFSTIAGIIGAALWVVVGSWLGIFYMWQGL